MISIILLTTITAIFNIDDDPFETRPTWAVGPLARLLQEEIAKISTERSDDKSTEERHRLLGG